MHVSDYLELVAVDVKTKASVMGEDISKQSEVKSGAAYSNPGCWMQY